ncbi:MAG: hypothetical protein IKA99_02455 [Clostridia bacterium]|nr:hypothetical protein [Clostridia bacterium]
MTLQQRIDYLTYVFNLLQDTNSRTEKEQIVKDIDPNYKEDFDFVIECLAGKHKFGYTYKRYPFLYNSSICSMTVKSVLQFLLTPAKEKDLSTGNIAAYVSLTTNWADFFEPIVNRTLRLGIGESLIEKSIIAPMLAKKFEGDIKFAKDGYFVTEKLDGNRCIARWDGEKWNFTSRNGKPMHVNFDMSGMDKRYVYDGEVLSPLQTNNSRKLEAMLFGRGNNNFKSNDADFNYTSGMINRHTTDKKLVYNVFDIVDTNSSYVDRRLELEKFNVIDVGPDVRIVPVLAHYRTADELKTDVWRLLNKVTDTGAEGLMINLANANYLNKRTDQLLKLKKVYTMDMKVTDWSYGTGKYESMLGNLYCEAIFEGKLVSCCVGTGISDEQRERWALYPEEIVGKIIEVSYFSLSQEAINRGTNKYSLRFPRLKRVRTDKTETSQY